MLDPGKLIVILVDGILAPGAGAKPPPDGLRVRVVPGIVNVIPIG